MTVGERIAEIRVIKFGWTQQELADKMKVSKTYVGFVESNKKRVYVRACKKFARALKVPVSSLTCLLKNEKERG